MDLKSIFRQVPDPRGMQGRDYRLSSILGLIVVSLLCGRRGMRAAFFLGRGLNKRQCLALGFSNGKTPCHATLTETLRVIDAGTLADVLGAACSVESGDPRHIGIDGKSMRASKDGEGHATHVLSAFCTGLQSVLGTEASRGRGMEIPDALKLLERLDLKGKIVTGDAMFCQKSIVAKIVEKGGDYIFPVKGNQKNSRENIQTAFNEPVFPLIFFRSGHDKAHGRIERRLIDVLPAKAAGIEEDWPSVKHICRVTRSRQVRKHGAWKPSEVEVVYLIASLRAADAAPEALLRVNRGHWGIEIMHRNKDVILGEDGYTNRSDNAPRNIFSLLAFTLKILKSISSSPTRAIEQFQDDRSKALRLFTG